MAWIVGRQRTDIAALLTEEDWKGNASDDMVLVSVAADAVVDGELLRRAVEEVEWLLIHSFGGPQPTRWCPQRKRPVKDPPTPSHPFPTWVFKLKKLKGLSLS